jgi:hypothetical protein
MPESAMPVWTNLTAISKLIYRLNLLEGGVGFSKHGTAGEYSTIDLSAALIASANTPKPTNAYVDMSNGLIMVVHVDATTLLKQLAGGLKSKPYIIASPIFTTTTDGRTLRVFNSSAPGQPEYAAAYGMIMFTDATGNVIGVVAPQETCRFTYSSAASKWYKLAGI